MILGGSGAGVAGTSSRPSSVVSPSISPRASRSASEWEVELRRCPLLGGLRLRAACPPGVPPLGEGGLRGTAVGEAMPLPIARTMFMFSRASVVLGSVAFEFRSFRG
eukprot:2972117-Pyramimonas_sp.AAC.2